MTTGTPTPAPTAAPAPSPATEPKLITHLVRIKQKDGSTVTRLVDAKRESQALAHVTADTISIDRATPRECVELGAAGVKIEKAAGSAGGAA